MRVVFMGTPSFAIPSLRALTRITDVVGVFTRPDAASGRGSKLRPSPVKEAAVETGLQVLQPRTLRDSDAQDRLRALAPDLVVVAAYGLILPREVLEMPQLGCVNVHASLLPRWRGAAPIQRAILTGDSITGVVIMRMEEGLDTGPYCLSGQTNVDDKSAEELTSELAGIGAELLVEALPSIDDGSCEWQEQDDSMATYAEKITKLDVALSPDLTADEALRRVRASSPQAAARASVAHRGMTVLEARRTDSSARSSEVVATTDGVVLGLSDGSIELLRVKPDGKAAMDASAWARGANLHPGATWTAS